MIDAFTGWFSQHSTTPRVQHCNRCAEADAAMPGIVKQMTEAAIEMVKLQEENKYLKLTIQRLEGETHDNKLPTSLQKVSS